jgi:DHA3 family tetracycline resistance protein-like MFS transporter
LDKVVSAYRLYLVLAGLAAFTLNTAFTLNLLYQSQVVGLGPLQLVLVGTALEVVFFVMQVPTGVIADLYSRRLSIVVGYLLMGCGLLLWGLIPTYAAVLAANAIFGIGYVCVDGAEQAWAADEIGPERVGRAFVRAGQLGQVGTLLGIVAAVALGSINLALPIVVAAIIALLLGIVLAVVMPENGWAPTPAAQRTTLQSMRAQVVDGGRAVRRSAALAGLVAGTLFVGLSSEGFDRLWQPHLATDVRLPSALSAQGWFGLIAVLVALGAIAFTGVLARWVDASRPREVGLLLAGMQVVAMVATIGFGLARQFWVAVIAYLVASLLREAAAPMLNSWLVASTTSQHRATVFSIHSQVDALGQIAGGPPVGYVGQRFSMGTGIAASGLFLLPAAAFFAWGAARSNSTVTPAESGSELIA